MIRRNFDVELRGVTHCMNLKHPNLVAFYDVRQDQEGNRWLIMEYVGGQSLSEAIANHPHGMPADEALDWLRGIAAGVGYLHEHGIVHRDLKPANVFRDEGLVKLGDYGLSKFISCSRRSGQTESIGTVHYMAPEIANGRYGKEIDIYALGVMLHEMLTGRVPFEGESMGEVLMKHLTAEPDLTALAEPFRTVVTRRGQGSAGSVCVGRGVGGGATDGEYCGGISRRADAWWHCGGGGDGRGGGRRADLAVYSRALRGGRGCLEKRPDAIRPNAAAGERCGFHDGNLSVDVTVFHVSAALHLAVSLLRRVSLCAVAEPAAGATFGVAGRSTGSGNAGSRVRLRLAWFQQRGPAPSSFRSPSAERAGGGAVGRQVAPRTCGRIERVATVFGGGRDGPVAGNILVARPAD